MATTTYVATVTARAQSQPAVGRSEPHTDVVGDQLNLPQSASAVHAHITCSPKIRSMVIGLLCLLRSYISVCYCCPSRTPPKIAEKKQCHTIVCGIATCIGLVGLKLKSTSPQSLPPTTTYCTAMRLVLMHFVLHLSMETACVPWCRPSQSQCRYAAQGPGSAASACHAPREERARSRAPSSVLFSMLKARLATTSRATIHCEHYPGT
ncbi:uncharacterized protein K452DRAFT_288195 [Aplosporella prunicola CBS 121167]|uniref:Uncharacterized protein n=1 Tax=Aplosporella prunicola CBS 121167 TaxID=1176127 RepID=A0A6A6BBB8_9PEZI|nr:uncharacterized protein K452DRAFT_288195 [Aplosporella prunicola CBS 121167]KAF2141499.1 hypothetical protein K452DRAFT_288195 [Aplosporella prunicola CBS 121167]